jgi:hypothetical protein
MLFKSQALEGLAAGTVDLAFRVWKRAAVRAGSTFRSPVGVIRVDSVDEASVSSITESDAQRAGYASRQHLLGELNADESTMVFRIALNVMGPDPRVALRETLPDEFDVAAIRARLDQLDQASRGGPWTRTTLRLIQAHPAVRAPDLANRVGRETMAFKRQVRRLKELGLTESLGTGYRLSPRGEAFLASE